MSDLPPHNAPSKDIFAAPAIDDERSHPFSPAPEVPRWLAELGQMDGTPAPPKAIEAVRRSVGLTLEDAERETGQPTLNATPVAEKDEQVAREADDVAAREAECDARNKAHAVEQDARRQRLATAAAHDADYHCDVIRVCFVGETAAGHELDDEYDLSAAGWEFSDDEADDSRLAEAMRGAITEALQPLITHYGSIGLIRADCVDFRDADFTAPSPSTPQFFLVRRFSDAEIPAASLAEFSPVEVGLTGPLNARITIQASTTPVNATLLHRALGSSSHQVGQFGGEATPDLLPTPGEDRTAWLERVAMPREHLARLVERWEGCGRSVHIFPFFGDSTERRTRSSPVNWLVDGVIPRGVLTLLAGDGSAGKTSLVHEWLSCLSGTELSRPRMIFGREVIGRAFCAVIYGEGAAGMDQYRAAKHSAVWGQSSFIEFNASQGELLPLLDKLRTLPLLDLLVIDPMRPFLKGDEKSSDTINEFYLPLERFAEAMNCAVVVTQHVLKTGLHGKSTDAARSAVLGATTVINRPRMVIAMDRIGSSVRFAPVKHNFAEEMLWCRSTEWSRWKHDPETHTLVQDGPTSSGPSPSNVDLDEVMDAVRGLIASGRVLHRTGRQELFELKLPQFDGKSRATIRKAIAALVDMGLLGVTPEGLTILGPSTDKPDQAA